MEQNLTPSERVFADQATNPASSRDRSWEKDVEYFKRVNFTASAVVEMGIHANSGGNLEVMGLLLGKIEDEVFHVLNVFPLPVEGTETRVNAQSEANEYIVRFLEALQRSGNSDCVVGWYHSHPGYGCWLSGIDVSTQTVNQKYQDPFLAVVIDPHETIKTGKISIGSFRTYPEDHVGRKQSLSDQSIPVEKVEDYGVHAHKYYEMESCFFKTESDEVALRVIRADHWADALVRGTGEMQDTIVIQEIQQIAKKVWHAIGENNAEARKTEVMMETHPGAAKNDVSFLSTNEEGPSRGTQLAVLSCNDAVTDIVKDLLFL
ncbi:COP9 signalosome complex subunit 5 [Picochlorum sp. SENEW3]|nr:COP9 signalosome complex subunit 5 [Picochlorum sp. SENEW3]